MKKIPLFLSITALACGTYLIARACGGGYDGEMVRYHIFNENLVESTNLAPFYFQTGFMDGITDDAGQRRGINNNALEWAAATGLTAADTAHIRRIVYERTAKDALRWASNFAKNTPDPREAKSVFMQAISKNADLKGVPNYLAFAKKCEGASHEYSQTDDWSEKPKMTKKYAALITEASKMYDAETNIFIKQRIGYQLVMLHRYNADWKNCKAAFEKYVANTSTKSVAYWWALAHYGTAHFWLGDAPKANYFLAQVFANDDYKRSRMHFGFDSDITEKSMLFCENDKEKMAVLSLSAMKKNSRALYELQQIAAIDPNDAVLATLLVREVNKVEDWVLSPRMIGLGTATNSLSAAEYDKKYEGVTDYNLINELNKKDDAVYGKAIYTWVAGQVAAGKIKNTALWNVSAAHLAFINQDFAKAETFLKQAENAKTPISKALQTQIHLTRIMASMNFDLKNGMTDDALLTELKWLQAERDAMLAKVGAKKANEYDNYGISPAKAQYSQWLLAMAERAGIQKNYVKQALFLAQAEVPYGTPDGNFSQNGDAWIYRLDAEHGTNTMEELIAYATESPKSGSSGEIQKILAAPIKKHVNRLWDFVGTKYYREDKLEQALTAYQKIPKTWFVQAKSGYMIYDEYLKNDPFWLGDFTLSVPKKYDRSEFIMQLIALKKAAVTANKTDKKAALAAYQVGAAYFNTQRGNAWARSHYWLSNGAPDEVSYEAKTLNNNTLARAKAAFEQAASLSPDKGFRAVCTRMIGECQWYAALGKYDAVQGKEAPTLAEQPTMQTFKTTFGAAMYKGLVESCDDWQIHLQSGR